MVTPPFVSDSNDDYENDPELDPQTIVVVLFVAAPTLCGIVSAIGVGFGSNSEWYSAWKRNRPCWAPPLWSLGSIWILMYMLSGTAAYLVHSDGDGFVGNTLPIIVYIINLILNIAWPSIFFILRKIKIALYNIVFVDLTFAITAGFFFNSTDAAGYLLIPYFIWLIVATSLNYYVLSNRIYEDEENNQNQEHATQNDFGKF